MLSPMRDLLKPLLLVGVVMAIPIVPFVLFGDWLEPEIERWLSESLSPAVVFALVTLLLAVDILLPVPSSVVSTFAGKMLGIAGGTAASWFGMTLGCVAAFALARAFGRPLALRLSSETDLSRVDALASRFGPMVLVLARPVPVFAEASVLLFGATRLSWPRFLLPMALSNLGIALTYAILGDRVQLPIALAASIALPLLAAAVARTWWREPTAKGDGAAPCGIGQFADRTWPLTADAVAANQCEEVQKRERLSPCPSRSSRYTDPTAEILGWPNPTSNCWSSRRSRR